MNTTNTKNHLERAKGFEPSTLTLATWRYFSSKDDTTRYWWELERTFEREILPVWGSRYCHDITKADIRELIWSKAERHPSAARTLWDGLRPFWRWLKEWDLISDNPFDSLSPPPAPKTRDRILTDDEIIAVWRATEDDWYWSPFFRLLLLTGQRREEISYASLVNNLLIIPSSITKTKEASVFPMTPMIAYEYNRKTFHHPSGYSRALKTLHSRSGTNAWRIHDLRRTFASNLAMLGTDPFIIERMLNHKIPGINGVYNQYSYMKEKEIALRQYEDYIISLTSCR